MIMLFEKKKKNTGRVCVKMIVLNLGFERNIFSHHDRQGKGCPQNREM